MYETRNDASFLRNWIIPYTPYNLKCPDPLPTVPSADATGITPNRITPTDTFYANDPWRAQ
eukprot:9084405-Pyramimonas_sp.AAC.2